MSKWVCIIDGGWQCSEDPQGDTIGPGKDEVVTVDKTKPGYLHLMEYPGFKGAEAWYCVDDFRPLLNGDLRHQLDDLEQVIEEENLVLVEQ